MSEDLVRADRKLTPANENPWYVLMTLYGEQEGEYRNSDLHNQNRQMWNSFCGRFLSSDEQLIAAKWCGVPVDEFTNWERRRPEFDNLVRRRDPSERVATFAAVVSKNPRSIIDMRRVQFDKLLCLERMIFVASIRLDGCSFEGRLSAGRTFFKSDLILMSSAIAGVAEFNHVHVTGYANFSKVKFGENALFSYSRFGSVNGSDCTFCKELHFSGGEISKSAWFSNASFNGIAYFSKTAFLQEAEGKVSFRDAVFSRATSFRETSFIANYPDFSGASLHDKTTFTDSSDYWPKGPQIDPVQAKASCAAIRHNLGKQGLPDAEHFFFRREMEFAGKSGEKWQRPPYWFFGWLSDYGYGILTPFMWLCLLVVGGAFILTLGLAGGPHTINFNEGLGLSFANAFNFLGLHKTFINQKFTQDLPIAFKAFSGFQTVAGIVLLFFLGLGLRTRFRMR